MSSSKKEEGKKYVYKFKTNDAFTTFAKGKIKLQKILDALKLNETFTTNKASADLVNRLEIEKNDKSFIVKLFRNEESVVQYKVSFKRVKDYQVLNEMVKNLISFPLSRDAGVSAAQVSGRSAANAANAAIVTETDLSVGGPGGNTQKVSASRAGIPLPPIPGALQGGEVEKKPLPPLGSGLPENTRPKDLVPPPRENGPGSDREVVYAEPLPLKSAPYDSIYETLAGAEGGANGPIYATLEGNAPPEPEKKKPSLWKRFFDWFRGKETTATVSVAPVQIHNAEFQRNSNADDSAYEPIADVRAQIAEEGRGGLIYAKVGDVMAGAVEPEGKLRRGSDTEVEVPEYAVVLRQKMGNTGDSALEASRPATPPPLPPRQLVDLAQQALASAAQVGAADMKSSPSTGSTAAVGHVKDRVAELNRLTKAAADKEETIRVARAAAREAKHL